VKPAPFEMARPASLDDALNLLAGHPDAKLIAGGQSLTPAMNFRLATPSLLIDLARVPGLDFIRCADGVVQIGAATRQVDLLDSPVIAAHAPLLARALPWIGHVQTRSRGTIGGSLCHADPSAELPLIMVTLGAVLTLRRAASSRTIAATDFFVGALTTGLAPDEILTEIAFPAAPPGTRAAFQELSRRRGDFAIVAVAAQVAGGNWRIAIGGLEAVPRFCAGLAAHLQRGGALAAGIEAELAHVEPLQDEQVSGPFRLQLACTLLSDCLTPLVAA
jgi:CO/xanthine dehydrogenase FAD-binding subunit